MQDDVDHLKNDVINQNGGIIMVQKNGSKKNQKIKERRKKRCPSHQSLHIS